MINYSKELIEREKELDCLYEISEILAKRDAEKENLLAVFSDSLERAMTYPDAAEVKITISSNDFQDKEETSGFSEFQAESVLENGETVKISISYNPPAEFVEREKKLIISAASFLANTLSKNDYYKKLENRTEELKTKNTALKEILFQINQDREDYSRSIRTASENMLLPLICELEDSSPSPRQQGLIRQLKLQMESLFSASDENLKTLSGILTPREIEICSLIKTGASTKEIALYLNISPQTVERHRNTVRKKLGINRQNINLVMHLRNM